MRSPRTIVGELLAIAALGAVGASIPQAGSASARELEAFAGRHPALAGTARALGLDHVFQTPGFLLATALASVSLSIVVKEQLAGLVRGWSQPLTAAHFERAPYRLEFERAAETPAPSDTGEPQVTIRTSGKLGLLGSPLLHTGLLVVIVAGVVRALFGVEAVVDLMEGETLPPTASAWGAQWRGPLAHPIALREPLTVDGVDVARYPNGDLRDLAVSVRIGGRTGQGLRINHPLGVGRTRLLLGSDWGYAALLEYRSPRGEEVREGLLLNPRGNGVFEAISHGPGALRVGVRTLLADAAGTPHSIEYKALDGNGSEPVGQLGLDHAATLGDGTTLQLRGMVRWVRIRATRDTVAGFAYLGIGLVLVGAAMIFTVSRVDTCVAVRREGGREMVTVALRAQRFPASYGERFERLVRENGGGA